MGTPFIACVARLGVGGVRGTEPRRERRHRKAMIK